MIWWVFGALLYGCFTFAVGCWYGGLDHSIDVKWHDA